MWLNIKCLCYSCSASQNNFDLLYYLYSASHLQEVLWKEAQDNTWPLCRHGEEVPFLCTDAHITDHVTHLEAMGKRKTTGP